MWSKDDKGRQILEAATRVFALKGYEAARVEDIAQVAQVGKGTVYEYFNSKQHLFEEMLKYSLRVYADTIIRAFSRGSTLKEVLEHGFLASFSFVNEHRSLARVLMAHPTGGPSSIVREWVLSLRDELQRTVGDILRRFVDGGESYDFDVAAQIVLGTLDSLSLSLLLNKDNDADGHCRPSPEYMAQKASMLLLTGLQGSRL